MVGEWDLSGSGRPRLTRVRVREGILNCLKQETVATRHQEMPPGRVAVSGIGSTAKTSAFSSPALCAT
jgi:hypothetical protein